MPGFAVRKLGCFVLGVIALDCGRGTPSPPKGDRSPTVPEAAPDPASVALVQSPRFVWAPPLAVTVTDVGSWDGDTSTASFWLDVCPVDERVIAVAFRDFKFALVNGQPASDPALAPALSRAEETASATPRLLLSRDGSYLGIEDPEEFVKRMARTFPGKNFEQVRSRLQRPDGRAVFEQAMGKYWQAWAGAWLAFVPSKGLEQKSLQDVPGAGSPLETETKFAWSKSPGFAHIRQVTRGDADVLRVIAADAVAALGAPDLPSEALEGTFESSFETVTEWPGVRRGSASWSRVVSLTVEGKSLRREERHDYAFDWQRSSAAAQCP